MIKINLAPSSELENPIWWAMDLIILLIVGGCGYGLMMLYFASMSDQLEVLQAEKGKYDKDYAEIADKITRYQDLTTKVKAIEDKIKGISSLLDDPVEKYKPILVMEMIQALKPSGVWLKNINYIGNGTRIEFDATAFNNLMISDFITNLKSLDNPYVDPEDIRSYIKFENIILDKTTVAAADTEFFKDAAGMSNFGLKIDIVKKPISPEIVERLKKSSKIQAKNIGH